MQRPRVVVLGNSYGATCQIPALLWGGLCDISAVVGAQRDKALATARQHGIPLGTDDVREALATDPQLVLVSTPVHTHLPLVQQVVAHSGAALLCEKPLARDVAEAEQILHACANRPAWVDHQLRFSPPRLALKALIDDGTLGELRSMRIEMSFAYKDRGQRPFSWWDEEDKGGGALFAIGSHLVDGALWMLGPIVSVRARLQRHVRTRPSPAGPRAVTSDDGAELWLTHASGVETSVTLSTARTVGARTLMEVDGSAGSAQLLDEDRLTFTAHDGTTTASAAALPSVDEVRAVNPSAFARCEPLFLRALVEALARGQRTLAGAATLQDGLSVQRVLDAARESHHSGARVQLPG